MSSPSGERAASTSTHLRTRRHGPRTWFITGAGRGLGRAFVQAVLEHGDRVVATARQPSQLAQELDGFGTDALVLPLDVTSHQQVTAAVEAAGSAMGRIDVLVNNAGYGLLGGIEEVDEDQVRAQLETNFFGALRVTRACLPTMRSQGSGHILQISSIAGLISAPNLGVYAASKFALEAASEALAAEVAPFGIRVTVVEPSGFRTDWAGSSMQRATPRPEYDEVLGASRRAFASGPRAETYRGVPDLAAQRLIEVVEDADPPLRLLLGTTAIDLVRSVYRRRLEEFERWEPVTRSVDAAPDDETGP